MASAEVDSVLAEPVALLMVVRMRRTEYAFPAHLAIVDHPIIGMG